MKEEIDKKQIVCKYYFMRWRHTQTEEKVMIRNILISKRLRNNGHSVPPFAAIGSQIRKLFSSRVERVLSTSLLFGEPSAVCVLRRLDLPVVGLQCREGGRLVPAAHLPSSREIICCWERSLEPAGAAATTMLPINRSLTLPCALLPNTGHPHLIQGLT